MRRKQGLSFVVMCLLVAVVGCGGGGSSGHSEQAVVVPEKKHYIVSHETEAETSQLEIMPAINAGQIVNLVKAGVAVALPESQAESVCWGGQCATWPGVPDGTGICVSYQVGKAVVLDVKSRDDGLPFIAAKDGTLYVFNKDFMSLFADEGMGIEMAGEHIRYAPESFDLGNEPFTCDFSNQPPDPEPEPEVHHLLTVYESEINIALAIEGFSLMGLAGNPVMLTDIERVCWFGDDVWSVRDDLCSEPIEVGGRMEVNISLPIGFERGMPFVELKNGGTLPFNTSWIDAGVGSRLFVRDADGVLVISP